MEGMLASDFPALVGALGFPIVACGYLLVRMEGRIKELGDSINKLTTQVEVLNFRNKGGLE